MSVVWISCSARKSRCCAIHATVSGKGRNEERNRIHSQVMFSCLCVGTIMNKGAVRGCGGEEGWIGVSCMLAYECEYFRVMPCVNSGCSLL